MRHDTGKTVWEVARCGALLAGAIAFGDQKLGPGDALFVPKETRYSLRAGEAGAEFVRVGFGDP